MQTELVQQSADLAFLFDGYHTVSELQDCLKLYKLHDRANSQTQVRKDKEVIALLQAELATHKKRITSLEDDLDITCQENKVYQDELDKQQLLLDAFQSQLDRMDSKIMAVNLQAMSINSKSHHSPLRSSSPEFYHSYKSNEDHTWLAPNAVQVLEPVLESEDDVLATPEASGAAQNREGEREAQQEGNCCRTSELGLLPLLSAVPISPTPQ